MSGERYYVEGDWPYNIIDRVGPQRRPDAETIVAQAYNRDLADRTVAALNLLDQVERRELAVLDPAEAHELYGGFASRWPTWSQEIDPGHPLNTGATKLMKIRSEDHLRYSEPVEKYRHLGTRRERNTEVWVDRGD